jgi:signal peptidase I
LVALLCGLYVRSFVALVVRVPSASMAPAILAGDLLLVDRLAAARGPLAALLPAQAPRVGDVLVFRSPEERSRLLVKRCAAIAGDRFGGVLVPAGAIALVGDAAERSHDSRAFGAVATGAVIGRARRVIWSVDHEGGGVRWRRTFAPVR